jgi:3-methylcrotonyl-CoA carboxylase alpha subunit
LDLGDSDGGARVKYRLRYRDEEKEISYQREKERFTFKIGERSYAASIGRVSENKLFLEIEGRNHVVFVAGEADEIFFLVKGRVFPLREATRGRRAARVESEEHGRDVTPPMPSVVVKILVKEGEVVQKAQGLIVVSAMKMETTLRAPHSGIVKKIRTEINARVAPGDILVEITPMEESDG